MCVVAVTAMFSSNAAIAAETIKMPADVVEKTVEEVKFVIDDTNYIIGNETKKADTAPYIKNGRTMMPVRYAVEAVGINSDDVKWDEEAKTVTIFKGDQIIQLTIGSDLLVVDGNRIKMDATAEIKDGRTMLPVSSIAKALGIEVKWNSMTKTITIYVEKKNKGEEKEAEVDADPLWDYAYEDLLNKALANSRELKKAEFEVERTESMRDNAKDMSNYIPLGNPPGPGMEADANQTYQMFKGQDFQHRMAKKQVDITKDTLAYNLKNAYYDVLESEDNKKIAKLAVDVESQNYKHAGLKYTQGLVSELEKKQAERNYEEAKKKYDMAVKELEKKYEKLNDFAGIDVKARYALKDDLAFQPIAQEDVDVHIRSVIAESPVIWALEQKIDLADLGLKLYVFNAGLESYDVKEINIKKAEIDLNSAKQTYDQSLRNLYTSLNQLKDQYETNKIALDKAKDDLRVAKVNVELGKMLPIDVQKATLQLEKTKKQLRDTIRNYNIRAMAYEKLWIAAPKE